MLLLTTELHLRPIQTGCVCVCARLQSYNCAHMHSHLLFFGTWQRPGSQIGSFCCWSQRSQGQGTRVG